MLDLATLREWERREAAGRLERARERRKRHRRRLWLLVRLCALAALLWLFWRIGYETGLIAALRR